MSYGKCGGFLNTDLQMVRLLYNKCFNDYVFLCEIRPLLSGYIIQAVFSFFQEYDNDAETLISSLALNYDDEDVDIGK